MLVRVDLPTLGRPTKPILRSFLTRPNLAARMNLASSPSPSFFLFFGGMAEASALIGGGVLLLGVERV